MSSATPIAVANFRFAKLKDLVIAHKNWKNPRTVTGLDEDSLLDLGKDMKARGIQDPLEVQKIWADDKQSRVINLVIDGQRRYLGAEEVFDGDQEIPVVDRSAEPIELTDEAADKLTLDILSSVARREGLSAYELSEVAQRLRDRNRTLADIAKAIRRDESWVSKILTARKNADPKLLLRWRKAEITEEQFKDLATIKDPEKQIEAAKETVKARETGDSAEARTRAKELAEQFKRDEKQKANGHTQDAPKQVTWDATEKKEVVKPVPPAVKVVVKPAMLEEMLTMFDKRPPTADYVKGVMHAVMFICGELEMAGFSKAWHAYVSRVGGTGKPSKKKSAKKTKAKKSSKKK